MFRLNEFGCVMIEYCVSFFNNLVNSNGRPCKCLQRTVTVRGAQDAKAASDKAKKDFEQLEHVSHWRCHAQFVEVNPVRKIATTGSRLQQHSSGSKALATRKRARTIRYAAEGEPRM